MNSEKRGVSHSALPETYRKGAALSVLGAAIGAGLGDLVGWFVAGRETHFIYAGLGAGGGILLGYLGAFVFRRRMELGRVEHLSAKAELVGAVLGFVLGAAGIVGFAMTGRLIGLGGALFFFACGWYLLTRHRDS